MTTHAEKLLGAAYNAVIVGSPGRFMQLTGRMQTWPSRRDLLPLQ
jgi:multimeric flavodoxin WrbA